jgi:hypothetical protein
MKAKMIGSTISPVKYSAKSRRMPKIPASSSVCRFRGRGISAKRS